MRKRNLWRSVGAILALLAVLGLGAPPAQAASWSRPASPGWFSWVVAQATHFWHVVANITQPDEGEILPGPKG